MLTGNRAYSRGGGAASNYDSPTTLNNCTLTGNRTANGVGGGASDVTLNNCTLTDNFAYHGGGAYATLGYGTIHSIALNNCFLSGNRAVQGGGAYRATLNHCTLTGNTAAFEGGGTFFATLNGCIVYDNTAGNAGENYDDTSTLSYSCTTPLPASGLGNITDAPAFLDRVGGNLRLQANSPCINAGQYGYGLGATDLDGNPRVAGVKVDIGAYEFQGSGLSDFTGWLWQFGLRTDGSSDYVDSDGDLMNNWQEWIAGTTPTDALYALRLFSPTNDASGITVSWQSVRNRVYFLERATDLGPHRRFPC